jgi:hypothetical protein
LHLFEAFVLFVQFHEEVHPREADGMAVVVDFSTIPEMFDRVTAKFANEQRPMLMRQEVV